MYVVLRIIHGRQFVLAIITTGVGCYHLVGMKVIIIQEVHNEINKSNVPDQFHLKKKAKITP